MMMMIRFFLLFTVSSPLFVSLAQAESCRFTASKGVIDLTTVGKSDGTAAFRDVSPGPSSNYKYSYNPCKAFSEGAECQGVAACQVSNDLKYQFNIGTQESASFNPGAGLGSSPTITYTATAAGSLKTTIVTLLCGDATTSELEALGEGPVSTYKFRLTHKCACWDGCGGSGPQTTTPHSGGGGSGSSIGGGAVFVIILLVVVFVYVVGFAAFYRFREQRSGLELIPHRTFWIALTGYARDGTVFIYQKVTGKGGGSNYASV